MPQQSLPAAIGIEPGAAALLTRLHAAGFAAYVVGGCVRDALLGLVPEDWDICTAAQPAQVLALFGRQNCIPTGLQHGTVTVRRAGRSYEVTTFRTEGPYSDGRRPDSVQFVTGVVQDLARRDFTINAMAYAPAEGLVDPFDGRADLAAGLVRAVGDPAARFAEDGLRMLRMLRFAARLGFEVAPATMHAALAARSGLARVSAERQLAELSKLLQAPAPGRWLLPAFVELVLPELAGCPQAQPGRWAQALRCVDAAPAVCAVRLAALFTALEGGGEAQAAAAQAALQRLRASRALTARVCGLLAARPQALPPEAPALQRLARYSLYKLGEEGAQQLAWLCAAQQQAAGGDISTAQQFARAVALQAQTGCWSMGRLAVDGAALMQALGLAPGRQLGQLLQALLYQVMDGALPNQPQALLAAARQLAAGQAQQNQKDGEDTL